MNQNTVIRNQIMTFGRYSNVKTYTWKINRRSIHTLLGKQLWLGRAFVEAKFCGINKKLASDIVNSRYIGVKTRQDYQ